MLRQSMVQIVQFPDSIECFEALPVHRQKRAIQELQLMQLW